MTLDLSISLSALPQAPLSTQLTAANKAGFSGASIWHHILADNGGAKNISRDCKEHNIKPSLIESIVGWETCHNSYLQCLDNAEQIFDDANTLNCKNVAICAMQPSDLPLSCLSDRVAAIAEKAQAADCSLLLEFLPWGAVSTLAQAWALLSSVNAKNLSLLIDVWHMQRSGMDLKTLASIPSHNIGHIQLSDASTLAHSNIMRETMEARLLPGQGAINFAALFDAFHGDHNSCSFSVEAFNSVHASLNIDSVCQSMHDSADSLLKRHWN